MARLSREQHDANVLCIASQEIRGKRLKEILDAWINTAYSGELHESTPPPMESKHNPTPDAPVPTHKPSLAEADPDIFQRDSGRVRAASATTSS